jgi:hypothetical protein
VDREEKSQRKLTTKNFVEEKELEKLLKGTYDFSWIIKKLMNDFIRAFTTLSSSTKTFFLNHLRHK